MRLSVEHALERVQRHEDEEVLAHFGVYRRRLDVRHFGLEAADHLGHAHVVQDS